MSSDVEVDELIEKLAILEKDGRSLAAEALVKIGSPAVDALIRALADGNWRVRCSAAIALGQIRDERVVKPLVELLEDADAPVRWQAMISLGQTNDPRAVQPLIEELEEPEIGSPIAKALVRLGIPALPALAEVLANGNDVARRSAALALGQIGEVRSVAPLVEALEDENVNVRRTAAMALGEIGDPSAVQGLIQLLKDHDEVTRRHAAFALGQIGDKDVMPRKILLSETMSMEDRVAALNALNRRITRYIRGNGYRRYQPLSADEYCELMRNDTNARVREAAEAMLAHLRAGATPKDSWTQTPPVLQKAGAEETATSASQRGSFWDRLPWLGGKRRTR